MPTQHAATRDTATNLRSLLLATALLGLSGCASFLPLPLPQKAQLAPSVEDLTTELPPSAAHAHPLDLRDGLDLTEIGTLAVLNNPDLKVERAKRAVADAQAFTAGLLPDPQLSLSGDHPTSSAPDLVNAWAFGLGYDITPLITRQARLDAARRASGKVRLDLLWQEWQTIQQAKRLAVRAAIERQRLALLRAMRDRYLQRYRHSSKALKAGDTTLDINGTDLAALVDTFSQLNQLEQTHAQTLTDLHHLLGLAPKARILLANLPTPKPLEPSTIQSALAAAPRKRPDLLALQAGYASQEASVRAAILGQFPSLSIGVNRASDTGGIRTSGLSLSLNLPLFTGNRGNIAIERATREQLLAEYRARLAATEADVDRLLRQNALISKQQARLEEYLPKLGKLVKSGEKAYQQGDIDALTFLNLESTWLNKRLERLNLNQSAWENRISLETLLAAPSLPPTEKPAHARQPGS